MILHIDMDAFFASIEQRDNPELKGKPVIISRDSARSVVATASYEARRYGIHSAMPVFQAKQRCRKLIIVPGRMKTYQTESRAIMNILAEFSPKMEPVSIDEAYLDITGCERLFGTPELIAQSIKKKIYIQLSLTSSIGIASVKFLAKIASDMQKPDGLTIIPKEKTQDAIDSLPIGKVPGIGKQAMKEMRLLQIETLGQIRSLPLSVLIKKFGIYGNRLHELSKGIDSNSVESQAGRKSISTETTLSHDIHDFDSVKQILLDRSQSVGRQLRYKKLVAGTVFIKLKFTDFTQITRQSKVAHPICSSADIFREAVLLFEKVKLKKKIRLVGVGVSALQDKHSPIQMELMFQENKTRKQWESVDHAVDSISEKYGTDMVKKASLNKNKGRIR